MCLLLLSVRERERETDGKRRQEKRQTNGQGQVYKKGRISTSRGRQKTVKDSRKEGKRESDTETGRKRGRETDRQTDMQGHVYTEKGQICASRGQKIVRYRIRERKRERCRDGQKTRTGD